MWTSTQWSKRWKSDCDTCSTNCISHISEKASHLLYERGTSHEEDGVYLGIIFHGWNQYRSRKSSRAHCLHMRCKIQQAGNCTQSHAWSCFGPCFKSPSPVTFSVPCPPLASLPLLTSSSSCSPATNYKEKTSSDLPRSLVNPARYNCIHLRISFHAKGLSECVRQKGGDSALINISITFIY